MLTFNPCDINGTHLRGYLRSPWTLAETTARLHACAPAWLGDEKVSVEWSGTFDGEPWTVYDWKGGDDLHIGGHNSLSLAAFHDALIDHLRTVSPVPISFARTGEYGGDPIVWPEV